jgi:hypothetical protein
MLDCQISTRCLPLQSDTITSQKAQFQASTVRLAARKGTICNVLVTTHTEEYQGNSVSILEVVITVIYLHTHGTEPQLFVVYHVARQLSQVKGIFLCLSCRSACSLYNCRLFIKHELKQAAHLYKMGPRTSLSSMPWKSEKHCFYSNDGQRLSDSNGNV